ncbi:MAG: hypothetical protein U0350_00015 [Caldilineaceae bacterium]
MAIEGAIEPAIVLMNVNTYEKIQRQEQRFYQIQLLQLKYWLEQVEQQWEDQIVRAQCVAVWQESMAPLWEVCPEPARGLCASLMLSTKQLAAERLSKQQVAALRYAIELLQSVIPTEAEIDQAYQQLMVSGIPPMVAFDKNFVQSYIDEL